MNVESLEDTPLLRRSRHAYTNVPGPNPSQSYGTPSLLSKPKAIAVSTQSPFSKLTNSSYDTHTLSKTTGVQIHRSASYSSAHPSYDSMSKIIPYSESQFTSPESKRRARGGSALDQGYHARQVSPVSLYATQGQEPSGYQSARNDSPSFSEELVGMPNASNHGSSVSQQFHNKSLKKEPDSLTSAFKLAIGSKHASSKSISVSMPGKPSAYYPSTQESSVHHIDDASHHRSVGLSALQGIHSQSNPSRASSVSVSIKEHATDDLSTLLIKGATDLRNTNIAFEEKSRALERLREELNVAVSEKVSLSRQLLLAKEKAKEGLESYAKKLDNMNDEFKALKARSKEFFAFAQQTKSSMVDVKELKEMVKKTVEHLETPLDESGAYMPTQEWKSTLNELRTDLANKQKIIDMFRDRLEFTQGDLAEAKNRVMELEGLLARNGEALQSSSQQLVDTVRKLAELSSSLRDQQHENTDILTRNAELESRLDVLAVENSELKHRLSQEVIEKESYTSLQQEYEVLRKLLVDRDEQIKDLQNTKDRLIRAEELLKDRDSRIQLLESLSETNIKAMETLRDSLVLAEAEVAKKSSLNERLENDLNSIRGQLQSESGVNERLSNEKDTLISREHSLVVGADKLRRDLEDYTIKLQQSELRYEMLQERFEDQAMVLQLEKKSHGDVQERLLSVEESHAHTIEELQHTTEAHVNELKGQIIRLEQLLNERQAELGSKEREYSMTLSALGARHAQELREVEDNLAQKSEEASLTIRELDALRNETESLRQKVRELQSDRDKHILELSEARRPLQAHTEEVTRLKCDIDQLRKINECSAQRAASIVIRYEQGDLSIEEKRLIDRVHRACQTTHEQELVTKGNEIRQRDHMIVVLEKRKSELEAQLARVLNIQASARVSEITENKGRSLIDLEELGSTQVSTTPFDVKGPLNSVTANRPAAMEECDSEGESCLSVGKGAPRPTKTCHQPTSTNVSLSLAPSFAKLAEKTEDPSDSDTELDTSAPIKHSGSKRKRAPDILAVDECDVPQHLRRSRTGVRYKSRLGKKVEAEASLEQDIAHVPKVKARKRR